MRTISKSNIRPFLDHFYATVEVLTLENLFTSLRSSRLFSRKELVSRREKNGNGMSRCFLRPPPLGRSLHVWYFTAHSNELFLVCRPKTNEWVLTEWAICRGIGKIEMTNTAAKSMQNASFFPNKACSVFVQGFLTNHPRVECRLHNHGK